jgi:hypothetical protein
MNLDPSLRQSEKRRWGTKLVRLPFIGHLRDFNHEKEVNQLMADAAKVIAATKLLYRWRRSSGIVALVHWDTVSQVFNNFDAETFAEFLGRHFDLVDTGGMNFGLPHISVASRLWEELTKESIGLEWADRALTDKRRRAA